VTELATIGVYGFTATTFIAALHDADVRLVLDVRQRRAVRGGEYAWANAKRLEAALTEAGIAYRHEPALAPTTALRELQYREDDREGVGKRSRGRLAPAFIDRYTAEILDRANLDEIVRALPPGGGAALLCVERDATACHRGVAAQRIADRFALPLTHLAPESVAPPD
jgi:uncharacterized protein (DUF488 family)